MWCIILLKIGESPVDKRHRKRCFLFCYGLVWKYFDAEADYVAGVVAGHLGTNSIKSGVWLVIVKYKSSDWVGTKIRYFNTYLHIALRSQDQIIAEAVQESFGGYLVRAKMQYLVVLALDDLVLLFTSAFDIGFD